MCGIWGYMDYRKKGMGSAEARVLRDMAVAGTLRGWDGTGMVFREAGQTDVFYKKKAVTGAELMSKDAWPDMLGGNRFVIGHNRAATIGSITDATTHPFSYNGVTGVHNGTISSWSSIFPEAKATMDSMAIMEALSLTEPDDECVTDILSKLDAGAYALAWYDSRVHELRFARNSDRPLHFVSTRNGLWWASELRMLEWILDKHHATLIKAWSMDTERLVCMPTNRTAMRTVPYIHIRPSYMNRVIDTGKGWGDWYNKTKSHMSSGYQGVKDGWDDPWDEVRSSSHAVDTGVKPYIPPYTPPSANYQSVNDRIDTLLDEAKDDVPYVDVLEWSATSFDLKPASLYADKLRQSIRSHVGLDPNVWPGSSLRDSIYDHVSKSGSDHAGGDLPFQHVQLPMMVCRVIEAGHGCDATFLGFVEIGNDLHPIVVECRDPLLTTLVESTLETAVAKLKHVVVKGLRIYANGDIGYVGCVLNTIDNVTCTITSAVNGSAVCKDHQWNYGEYHPETYALTSSWAYGWADSLTIEGV